MNTYTVEEKQKYMKSLVTACEGCSACNLHAQKTNTVRPRTLFTGELNLNSEVMFVGEAPGYHEDMQGIPFVGKSGQIIQEAVDYLEMTENVSFTNTVRCRPLDNRDPTQDEKNTCFQYLRADIRIIRPKLIVAVGKHAANTLLQTEWLTMRDLSSSDDLKYIDRERDIEIPMICVYHPSYYLRLKRQGGEAFEKFRQQYWESFKAIKEKLLALNS